MLWHLSLLLMNSFNISEAAISHAGYASSGVTFFLRLMILNKLTIDDFIVLIRNRACEDKSIGKPCPNSSEISHLQAFLVICLIKFV